MSFTPAESAPRAAGASQCPITILFICITAVLWTCQPGYGLLSCGTGAHTGVLPFHRNWLFSHCHLIGALACGITHFPAHGGEARTPVPPLPCTAHSQRELLVSDSLGPSPRAIRRLLIAWADDRPLRLKWWRPWGQNQALRRDLVLFSSRKLGVVGRFLALHPKLQRDPKHRSSSLKLFGGSRLRFMKKLYLRGERKWWKRVLELEASSKN